MDANRDKIKKRYQNQDVQQAICLLAIDRSNLLYKDFSLSDRYCRGTMYRAPTHKPQVAL